MTAASALKMAPPPDELTASRVRDFDAAIAHLHKEIAELRSGQHDADLAQVAAQRALPLPQFEILMKSTTLPRTSHPRPQRRWQ